MPPRESRSRYEPVPLGDVTVDDAFWNARLDTNREVSLEHQYDQLAAGGCLENFRRAAADENGGFEGMWFADSDAYKWLEAASYVLANHDDPKLRARVDEVIDLVAAAQEDDGYLNTYFALEEPAGQWTNLHMMHELYCAGHLIEAAVAHHRATGETSLLDVAVALADHVDDVFGTGVGDLDGVPGHEEIELALVKLFRETDEERYLDLARYFVDRRGRADSSLEWEVTHVDEIAGDVTPEHFFADGEYDGSYAQAHLPVCEQATVEGHAVRAMYLLSGVADLVAETGDELLEEALLSLWENVTSKRMYLTGGIGPEAEHEGFTVDYDLRNRTAYAETCAAVGSVFWNHRLFQLTGEGRFYDVLERALYNGVIAGVSVDGTEFFYENPLESLGHHHRKGWFQCACCPPNAARLLASLGRYVYAQDRDDEPYVNLFVGSDAELSVDGVAVHLAQRTEYPWGESTTVSFDSDSPVDTALHVRVPPWCTNVSLSVNGSDRSASIADGFAVIERTWSDGDELSLEFDLPVRRLVAHPDVSDDADRVAFQRGPLVYCVEDVDVDRPCSHLRIDPEAPVGTAFDSDLLGGVVTIAGDARAVSSDGWDDALYGEYANTSLEATSFTAIPYYGWDNRESGRMLVWLPTA